MRALILFLCACGEENGAVIPAITITVNDALCSWDVLDPVSDTGWSDSTFGSDGEECVPPEGGDVFEVGFGWRGLVTKLSVPRPIDSGLAHFDASQVGLYVNAGGAWCTDWQGIVSVRDTDQWIAGVDARCSSGSGDGMRLVAQWGGKRRP